MKHFRYFWRVKFNKINENQFCLIYLNIFTICKNSLRIRTHKRTPTRTCTPTHTHINTQTHTHTHSHTRAHIYTHTQTHTHLYLFLTNPLFCCEQFFFCIEQVACQWNAADLYDLATVAGKACAATLDSLEDRRKLRKR